MSRRYARHWPLMIVLLLVMWNLLLIHLNAPWFGHHDANGVWLSAASRNYRVYSLEEFGLVPLINLGPVPPEDPRIYVHHPPLVVWAVTLAHQIFGDYELSARMVSIFGTMASVAAFYVLCRRLYNARRALLCVALYAFTPMLVFFGRMPNHEPLSLAFLLIFAALFVDWSRNPSRRHWWLMIGAAVLAIWTAWASFYFVVFISLFSWRAVRPGLRRYLVALSIAGGLAVASVVLFFQLAWPDTIAELVRTFLWRTSTVSEISESFTMLEFLAQQAVHLLPHATIAVFLLGGIGIIPTIRHERGLNRPFILALGVAALTYVMTFRSASFVHDYYKIYLMPFLAMTAANTITHSLRHRHIRRFAHPALISLFAISTIAAVLYLSGKYTASFADDTLTIADNIAAHSERPDVVLTNLQPANPAIEYYAFRHIRWAVAPEDLAEQVAASDQPTIYAFCGPTSDVPPDLAQQAGEWSEGCLFVRLR